MTKASDKASEHSIFVVSDKTVVPESEKVKKDSEEGRDPWARYDRRFRNVHRIPGLSRYFLLLPDDVLFVGGPKELAPDWFFTTTTSSASGDSSAIQSAKKTQREEGRDPRSYATPILYDAGGFVFADCMGHPGVGQGHGPVLVDKCVWQRLARNIWSPSEAAAALAASPSSPRKEQPKANSKYGFEAACL